MAVRSTYSSRLILLHWLSSLSLLLSFLTGLRMFVANQWHSQLGKRWVEWLPSGDLFALHVGGAWLWLLIIVLWWLYRRDSKALKTAGSHSALKRFNHLIIRIGRVVLPLTLLSGILLWAGSDLLRPVLITLHAILAFTSMACVLIHLLGQFCFAWWPGLKAAFLTLPSARAFTLSLLIPIALLVGGWLLRDPLNHLTLSELPVKAIPEGQRITLDGKLDESFWQTTTPVIVSTRVPGSTQHVPVEIRAALHGRVIYFAFSWQDPTQSLAHLPLIKTEEGWKIMQDGVAIADERTWYEDKFAVIFADKPDIAGNGSFHFGRGRPQVGRNESQRGLHYMEEGIVDLWHWKAVRNHGYGVLDDSHIATPYPRIPGAPRYTAGYQADLSLSNAYSSNFLWFEEDVVQPKRLPNNPDDLEHFQQLHDDESATPLGLSWYESKPYDLADDNYPVGTLMPSVLWTTTPDLDRADAAARGHWHDGRWTLEVIRGIESHSEFDLDINDGTFMWVATFDHEQSNHSYHLRPLRLRFQ